MVNEANKSWLVVGGQGRHLGMLHKGTLQYGIVLEKNENIGLNGFSDVD